MKKERGLELNVLSKRAESTYLHVSFQDNDLSDRSAHSAPVDIDC